jgi:hypothetical protein
MAAVVEMTFSHVQQKDVRCASLIAVYAVRFYSWGSTSYAPFSRNISVWVSPTEVWTNGSLCVSNFSPAPSVSTVVPSFIPCANPISNTRYVTVTKPLANNVDGVSVFLFIWELQVLRAGKTHTRTGHCRLLLRSGAAGRLMHVP